LVQIRFTLWTSEVISHRMLYCSGVAMLMSPGADHKNTFSFHSSHLLTTIKNEKKSCIMLIITIKINKASWTSQSNTQKLKRVLFLILDYGTCFFCLLATLLVITFPIFSAFFTFIEKIYRCLKVAIYRCLRVLNGFLAILKLWQSCRKSDRGSLSMICCRKWSLILVNWKWSSNDAVA